MTYTFNLVDQPWIPCTLPDGRPQELSLGEIFARAPDLRDISDASPLVTISIHRLLLAILHRTHGPKDEEAWGEIWSAGSFDTNATTDYLNTWRRRFDLFDDDRPFFQTIEIEPDPRYARSIAQMVYGMTLGNYVTLFDHSRQDQPPELTPAETTRQVLAIQNFAVGGLTPYRSKHGEPEKPFKYADHCLLTKGAVALARGNTLFETLMLNLHAYDGVRPFEFDLNDDRAAWERDEPALATDRLPDGYVDLLTWQGRRVRLFPETNAVGETVVRSAAVMKGHGLPDGIHLRNFETMLAFSHNPKAGKNQDPWPVLSLQPARAVWRDSTSLFQSTGADHQRPRILDWVADLAQDGYLPWSAAYSVDIYGLATNRASVDLWRHEQLPLPIGLLDDDQRQSEIQRALELADDVNGLFSSRVLEVPVPDQEKPRRMPSPLQIFAENLLTMRDDMNPDRDAVRQLVDALAPADTYWSRLETPFRDFLVELERSDQLAVRHKWADEVRGAARAAWKPVFQSFDSSARTLKAAVNADSLFEYQLGALLRQYAPPREEVAAHATQTP